MIYVGAALVIVIQAARIFGREQPSSRMIRREEVVDGWIEGLYPAMYVRTHGAEPESMVFHVKWAEWRRGEALTDAELDELVVDLAFSLEFRARRVFAGRQFKGILRGRMTVVWGRDGGDKLHTLLRRHRPGPAAQAHLDRALGWWEAARKAGMLLLEWDEDGYDDISDAFAGIAAHAKTTPAIDVAEHGVTVRQFEVQYDDPPLPFPTQEALTIVAALAVMLVVGVLGPRSQSTTGSAPLDCDDQVQRVRRAAERERGPATAATIDEVLAAVDAGDYPGAHARWTAAPGGPPEGSLLGVQLFLLSTCPRR